MAVKDSKDVDALREMDRQRVFLLLSVEHIEKRAEGGTWSISEPRGLGQKGHCHFDGVALLTIDASKRALPYGYIAIAIFPSPLVCSAQVLLDDILTDPGQLPGKIQDF